MMGLSVRTPVKKSRSVVQSKVLPSPQVTVEVVTPSVSTASTLPVMVSNPPVAAAVFDRTSV